MADTKVTGLTNVDPLADNDEFYLVQASTGNSSAVLASVVLDAAGFIVPKFTRSGTAYTNLCALPGCVMVGTHGVAGVVTGRVYHGPIYVSRDTSFDQLRLEVTTAQASGEARMAIYAMDANWQPTDLVVDSGAVDCSTTGLKTVAISETLSRGRYSVAFKANDSNLVFRVISALLPGPFVMDGTNSSSIRNMRASESYGAFADPGTAIDDFQTNASPGTHYRPLLRIA